MKTVTKIQVLDYRGRPTTSPADLITYLCDPDGLEAWVYYTENGREERQLLTDLVGEEVMVGNEKVRVM